MDMLTVQSHNSWSYVNVKSSVACLSSQVREVVSLMKITDVVETAAQDKMGLISILALAMTTTGRALQLYIAQQLLDYTSWYLTSSSANGGQVRPPHTCTHTKKSNLLFFSIKNIYIY